MSEYKPYIDENGRLYLFSLCDGTLIFLQQLIVSVLLTRIQRVMAGARSTTGRPTARIRCAGIMSEVI